MKKKRDTKFASPSVHALSLFLSLPHPQARIGFHDLKESFNSISVSTFASSIGQYYQAAPKCVLCGLRAQESFLGLRLEKPIAGAVTSRRRRRKVNCLAVMALAFARRIERKQTALYYTFLKGFFFPTCCHFQKVKSVPFSSCPLSASAAAAARFYCQSVFSLLSLLLFNLVSSNSG